MIIIKGYKAKATDIQAVEDLLCRMQESISRYGTRLYASLLAEEIETMVDDIALNVISRPATSIYDAAVQSLDQKISYATAHNQHLPYNLLVQTALFTYEGSLYIKVMAENAALCKGLKSVDGLSEFFLYDEESEGQYNAERRRIWDGIAEVYRDGFNPLCRQLYPDGPIHPSWDKIAKHFHTREQRAETRVRYQLTNTLLNMISMGKEISPQHLLPYLDTAMAQLDDPVVKAEGRRLERQVLSSIINITETAVRQDPKAAAPQTFD